MLFRWLSTGACWLGPHCCCVYWRADHGIGEHYLDHRFNKKLRELEHVNAEKIDSYALIWPIYRIVGVGRIN
jgi:hypothetical protein